jgi:hypothetical protein
MGVEKKNMGHVHVHHVSTDASTAYICINVIVLLRLHTEVSYKSIFRTSLYSLKSMTLQISSGSGICASICPY